MLGSDGDDAWKGVYEAAPKYLTALDLWFYSEGIERARRLIYTRKTSTRSLQLRDESLTAKHPVS